MIAAGGGGIPTGYVPGRKLRGIEAVIDKDFCSELLARELEADLFIMATDAEAVFCDWGKPTARAIRHARPSSLTSFQLVQWGRRSMPPAVSSRQRESVRPLER